MENIRSAIVYGKALKTQPPTNRTARTVFQHPHATPTTHRTRRASSLHYKKVRRLRSAFNSPWLTVGVGTRPHPLTFHTVTFSGEDAKFAASLRQPDGQSAHPMAQWAISRGRSRHGTCGQVPTCQLSCRCCHKIPPHRGKRVRTFCAVGQLKSHYRLVNSSHTQPTQGQRRRNAQEASRGAVHVGGAHARAEQPQRQPVRPYRGRGHVEQQRVRLAAVRAAPLGKAGEGRPVRSGLCLLGLGLGVGFGLGLGLGFGLGLG